MGVFREWTVEHLHVALTWYLVAMVLMVPVKSMHIDSTTTEARMAALPL
jgi:hypothetical protein